MNSPFKVLQWNVLDPEFADQSTFPLVKPECLEWVFRRPLINKIIDDAAPDIICLQEVSDNKNFDLLDKRDEFEYIYLPKHSTQHGILFGYNKTKFEVVKQHAGNFVDEDGSLMSQNFLYIRLLLKCSEKKKQQYISIIVTHLKSKRFFERRMMQINQMVAFIKERNILEELLICADMNSEEEEETQKILKDMGLSSVRPGLFTTLKYPAKYNCKQVKRKIDYIYYNPLAFKLIEDWSLNNEVEHVEGGCPNHICPSDHLPIIAVFSPKENDLEPSL